MPRSFFHRMVVRSNIFNSFDIEMMWGLMQYIIVYVAISHNRQ